MVFKWMCAYVRLREERGCYIWQQGETSVCQLHRQKCVWKLYEWFLKCSPQTFSSLRAGVGGNQHWYASLDFNLIIENCLHTQNRREREKYDNRLCLSLRHSDVQASFNHGHSARPEKSLCPEPCALLRLKQCSAHTRTRRFSLKPCDHFPIASDCQKGRNPFLSHTYTIK